MSSADDLLGAVSGKFPDDISFPLNIFIDNYMTSDGGIVSSSADILRHVHKRWGDEAYMFLLGYLGGGDFPKREKGTRPKRDEHGRWITPS